MPLSVHRAWTLASFDASAEAKNATAAVAGWPEAASGTIELACTLGAVGCDDPAP